MSFEVVALVVLFFVGLVVAGVMVRSRARRQEKDTEVLEQSVAEGRVPQTLHPVIDPDKCMGSLSCLSVCPEGDILGVVDGKAALVNPSACIGHGKCALECPVNAITLVFGTSQRGVDLPEVSEFFETSRPGVHIVGELGGMGLIKNAITQGVQVSEYLAKQLKPQNSGESVDVVVVGAGPAGLATALGLRHAGLSFRVLDQESVGGTIAHYPRQKVVMTERVALPIYGKFGKSLISKEELLGAWQEAMTKGRITVENGTKVEHIEGADGAFTVMTTRGPVQGRKVVLAVGRRGTPRKLGVPGEDSNRVTYRLIDAQQYEGARVMVVGGGDAALEAAIQIAQETDAEVSLSYRQADLGKAREANKARFKELVQQGRIYAFMPSTIKAVTPKTVKLDVNGRALELHNDFIIACLGGELPTEFLKANGISMQRLHGEALGGKARAARGSAKQDEDAKSQRRLALGLFAFGALIIAALAIVGRDYYQLPMVERLKHPAHSMLKPAGVWGHGVGIVATLFMMSNFLYAVRKRWERLKGFSSIRRWLTFHQFVGFMSPAVIAFHAAFRSNNVLASSTAIALGIVVLTGVVGRFIFGLVPSGQGHQNELGELSKRYERLKTRSETDVEHSVASNEVEHVNRILEHATAAASDHSLFAFLVHLPVQRLRDARDLGRLKHAFTSREQYREFRTNFAKLRTLQAQVGFYRALKRLMSVWRVLHVVLAVLLVLMISAHIGVSLFLGYKWVFK